MTRFAPAALAASLAVLLTGCGPSNLVAGLRNPFGYGACGLVIIVLDVLAIVEVFNSRRTDIDKILWAIVIVILPFFGLLAWYLIGRKK